MIVVGDVHREWTELARRLRRHAITGEDLVQVGDFGVGFADPRQDQAELAALDAVLGTLGDTLYVIRGNHDDPAYFDGTDPTPYRHITFLPDYSILRVGGRTLLCAGGAISVDRAWRRRGRDYWPDEGFRLNEQTVDRLDLDDLWAVVTHTAPDFAAPLRHDDLVRSFAREDPTLLENLRQERRAVRRLYELIAQRARPRYWFYGHFHTHGSAEIAGTRFILLDIMEIYPTGPGASR